MSMTSFLSRKQDIFRKNEWRIAYEYPSSNNVYILSILSGEHVQIWSVKTYIWLMQNTRLAFISTSHKRFNKDYYIIIIFDTLCINFVYTHTHTRARARARAKNGLKIG